MHTRMPGEITERYDDIKAERDELRRGMRNVLDLDNHNAIVRERNQHIADLDDELETERMRVVACGVAALANTPKTAAQRIGRDNPNWTASYQDVCDAVDREIQLRELCEKMCNILERDPKWAKDVEHARATLKGRG